MDLRLRRVPALLRAWNPPRGFAALAPLVGYAAFAVVWLGRGVVGHPFSRVIGDPFSDKTIYMWSFMWWPHAIAHGNDPFPTHAIWSPHGVDLAWATSVPGLSLLLTPISESLGPVFAYNLDALAAPPLAAWTAYLLARRLTRHVPAALVAGFLFGFSPYVIGEDTTHLNLSFVCLIPVVGLLAVAYVQGDLGRWRYVCLLGATLAFQFYVSTELFATATLVAVITLVLAFALLPGLRRTFVRLAGYSMLGYGIALALATPYLVHVFAGISTPPPRGHNQRSGIDVLNTVLPTKKTLVRPPGSESIVQHFTSNASEQGAYIGVPLLLILVLAAIRLRGVRRRGYWILLLSAVAADILALGWWVRVDGRKIMHGVWTLFAKLPAYHEALPIRFDLYAALFLALAAALWLATPGGRLGWRVALAALAVVAFLPSPGYRWASDVPQSSFFNSSAYRAYLHPNDTVLVLPYGSTGWSMLWQAETHFRFSMIGGHVGRTVTKPERPWKADYLALVGVPLPGGGAEFRRFLLAHHVNAVVEGPGTQPWALRLIAAALPDVHGVRVRDATVLRLPSSLPAALPQGP